MKINRALPVSSLHMICVLAAAVCSPSNRHGGLCQLQGGCISTTFGA